MKLKLAVAFAVLLLALQAHADSTPITIDVTAISCQAACGFPFEPALDLQAQFVVEQVTGTFFNSAQGLFTGTEYEVMSMTGTLNGNPITQAAPPFGIGSWLNDGGPDQFGLGTVYFTADGSFDWLENDFANDLLEISNANGGTNNPIGWTAADPAPAGMPEPSTWLLLVAGIGFVLVRAAKTRKQLAG
jgi:hypothetical protein